MKIGNIIMAIFFMILAIVFFVASLSFGIGSSGDVGAGFFPKIISMIIMVLSVIVIAKEIHTNDSEVLMTSSVKKTIIVSLAAVVYVFIMNIVGFLIATPIFIAFDLWIVKNVSLKKIIIISITLAIAVYICFAMGLAVKLPKVF